MRSLFVLVVTAIVLVSSFGTMHAHGFGAGIIVGEPTGVCFKQWLGSKNALDFAAAWSFGHEDAFQVHMDYLFHKYVVIVTRDHKIVGGIPLFVGVGGRFKFDGDDKDDDGQIGVRFPLGISYVFAEAPIDIFFEIVPIMDVAPDTDFSMNAAVGFRYYF